MIDSNQRRLFLKGPLILIAVLLGSSSCIFAESDAVTISGELKKWHTVTLDVRGPEVGESDKSNPFLNYRLDVEFSNDEHTLLVPGYFAADGDAANSGASEGNVWRVKFAPPRTGTWTYRLSFVEGTNVAVETEGGQPIAVDGLEGSFAVQESDKPATDFRTKGRLLVGPDNYLQFTDSKEHLLKAGAGSPENFLAFADFDGTYSLKKEIRQGEAFSSAVKTWSAHLMDWKPGDPTWKGGKGKGIIGALNYLASKGVNSVYFLTMNVYGDGQDIWPWISPYERTRFDCSKLDQWAIVFEHMQSSGILAHVITQETENELMLDVGNTGLERKLYYRELIARFSHQLALIWNLGEENGYARFAPNAQNTKQRKAMSAYFKATDPYQNPVVLHTHARKEHRDEILVEMMDDPNLDGPSFQIGEVEQINAETLFWHKTSMEEGLNWILPIDEVGPASTGARPDKDDPDHDFIRAHALWGNLMAKGSGVEWYFGFKYDQNDLACEDWRSRDNLWDQSATAIRFFNEHLPYAEMAPANELTTSDSDFVLAKPGDTYCIYLPAFESVELNLEDDDQTYSVEWFNPKTGGELVNGTVREVTGGAKVLLGLPIAPQNLDWVILLKKKQSAARVSSS